MTVNNGFVTVVSAIHTKTIKACTKRRIALKITVRYETPEIVTAIGIY